MGMYTELIFGAKLKTETPKEVIDTLLYLTGTVSEEPANMQFNEGRNPLLGGSYYFAISSSVTKMWYDSITKQWILSSRANIKNYGSEIENFLQWIKPYIDQGSGTKEMYAMTLYEEDPEPTIYYLEN